MDVPGNIDSLSLLAFRIATRHAYCFVAVSLLLDLSHVYWGLKAVVCSSNTGLKHK